MNWIRTIGLKGKKVSPPSLFLCGKNDLSVLNNHGGAERVVAGIRFLSLRKLENNFDFVLFCFVLFCFVLFCFVLFCFVLFCYFILFCFCACSSINSPRKKKLQIKKTERIAAI